MRLVLLIGPPGVGKTTAVNQAWPAIGCEAYRGLWLTHRDGGVTEIGRLRLGFAGSDGLAMNAGPKACQLVETTMFDRLLVEGDRLAYRGFLDAARRGRYDITLVSLEATGATVSRRRRERGSNQDSAWIAGRETKVRNLTEYAERQGIDLVRLDGEADKREVGQALRRCLP